MEGSNTEKSGVWMVVMIAEFEAVLVKVAPNVSTAKWGWYEVLRETFVSGPGRSGKDYFFCKYLYNK